MIKLNDLTKEKLTSLYIDSKKSLGDIARLYKDAENGLFLDQKYRRFLEGLKGLEGGVLNG